MLQAVPEPRVSPGYLLAFLFHTSSHYKGIPLLQGCSHKHPSTTRLAEPVLACTNGASTAFGRFEGGGGIREKRGQNGRKSQEGDTKGHKKGTDKRMSWKKKNRHGETFCKVLTGQALQGRKQ